MANQHDEQDNDDTTEAVEGDAASGAGSVETASVEAASAREVPTSGGEGRPVVHAAGQLGVTRYVHAAFLAVAVGAAYVAGKVLEATWNTLASWSAATAYIPWLVRYREDERPAFTMTAGLLIGVGLGYWLSRQSGVRRWADDVAGELAKVHWPSREMVQNGTVVVVVAGLFATLYVGLLDRFWVFVTTLVYGA